MISDFRLQIADLVAVHDYSAATPKSQIPNPKSRRPRSGVTILEVLFSIGVTAIGLLGAIALFPVANAQARKARLNDAAACTCRSAVHTFDTMGMRRPDRWYYWNGSNNFAQVFNPSTLSFNGSYAAAQSYCIDPRFLVANASTSNWPQASFFPYNSNSNGTGAVNTSGQAPRMNRIGFFGAYPFSNNTLATLVNGNKLLTDTLFLLDDDLAYVRPGLDDVSGMGLNNDRSLPAIQLFDKQTTGSTTTLIKRQSQGHMSWMATLVPKVELATGSGSDQFVLSVVVFHDRPSDLSLDDSNERVVSVFVQGDGSTGGEVALYVAGSQSSANQQFATERLKLKPNDWLMLSCNMQYSTYTLNRFQWYRVTHCDSEVEFASAGSGLPDRYQLYATLMGQDWNWGGISTNNPQATIVQGVIAVHEKTIRLDYGSTF